MAFELIRFSGSTLEPSSEPIMLYEPHYYEKQAGRSLHIQLEPSRPTPPLNRKDKPPHIIIPKFNADDNLYSSNENEYSAWSCNNHEREQAVFGQTVRNDRGSEDSTTAGATTTTATTAMSTSSQSEEMWDTPNSITSTVHPTSNVAANQNR